VERNPEFPQADKALSALKSAYELAEQAVKGEDDQRRAFELATILTEASRQMTIRLGRMRALQGAHIRDQESLSLAGLADRLGVSKTRAQQIMEIAAKARKGSDRG
jgi:hypothetical protein